MKKIKYYYQKFYIINENKINRESKLNMGFKTSFIQIINEEKIII